MIVDTLRNITSTGEKVYSYAYVSGYYESTINAMFSRLNEKDQEFFTKVFEDTATRLVDTLKE